MLNKRLNLAVKIIYGIVLCLTFTQMTAMQQPNPDVNSLSKQDNNSDASDSDSKSTDLKSSSFDDGSDDESDVTTLCPVKKNNSTQSNYVPEFKKHNLTHLDLAETNSRRINIQPLQYNSDEELSNDTYVYPTNHFHNSNREHHRPKHKSYVEHTHKHHSSNHHHHHHHEKSRDQKPQTNATNSSTTDRASLHPATTSSSSTMPTSSSSSNMSTSSSMSSSSSSNTKTLQILEPFQKLEEHRNKLKGFQTEEALDKAIDPIYEKLHATIPAERLIELIEKYIKNTKKLLDKELGKGEFFVQKQTCNGPNEYCVVGDIHGSLHALMQIFQDLYINKYLDENLKLKENFFIIFTGDYTDRGLYGSEVWYLLLSLKLAEGNWNKVFLIRGNHEEISMSQNTKPIKLRFDEELKRKYPSDYKSLIMHYNKLCNYLPQAIFINNYDPKLQENNWMMFCHGGLDKPNEIAYFLTHDDQLQIKILQSEDPSYTGFLWYDVGLKGFNTITRGSFLPNLSLNILSTLDIKILCRGHQHFGDGLKLGNNPDDNEHSSAIPDKDKIKSIPISSVKPCIFTFTTATEFEMSNDIFYGIIKTNVNFDEWQLIPHLIHRYQQK